MNRVVLLAALIALVGCSAGKAVTTTSDPAASPLPVVASSQTTPKQTVKPLSYYAAQCTRIVAPVNAALAALPNSPTQAQLDAAAAKVKATDDALLRAPWPSARVSDDIAALVRADGPILGELTPPLNVAQLGRDGGTARASVSIVRADLGLPPPA